MDTPHTDRHAAERRTFLRAAAATSLALVGGSLVRAADGATETGKLHIACNQYPWFTFFKRDKRDFNRDLPGSMNDVAASGVHGFEPLVGGPDYIDRLAEQLAMHKLEMRSLYVNSTLHEADKAEKSIAEVMAIAKHAKAKLGTRIVVTNPTPINWGGKEDKTPQQLETQAAALGKLGAMLRAEGVALSYHNHDAEMRNDAREVHAMMACDPTDETFCLDAHWVYRGSGDNHDVLFDIVERYGARITELHLRQSRGGVWTETFGDGDIDYRRLASHLLKIGNKPHLVLEQAVEKGTPRTMTPIEAHRQALAYAADVFAKFA